MMAFEAQTIDKWTLTAATGGKQDRCHPSKGTHKDLKLEKKPWPKFKHQTEGELLRLLSPLVGLYGYNLQRVNPPLLYRKKLIGVWN